MARVHRVRACLVEVDEREELEALRAAGIVAFESGREEALSAVSKRWDVWWSFWKVTAQPRRAKSCVPACKFRPLEAANASCSSVRPRAEAATATRSSQLRHACSALAPSPAARRTPNARVEGMTPSHNKRRLKRRGVARYGARKCAELEGRQTPRNFIARTAATNLARSSLMLRLLRRPWPLACTQARQSRPWCAVRCASAPREVRQVRDKQALCARRVPRHSPRSTPRPPPPALVCLPGG